jgi:hypothetical protein
MRVALAMIEQLAVAVDGVSEPFEMSGSTAKNAIIEESTPMMVYGTMFGGLLIVARFITINSFTSKYSHLHSVRESIEGNNE